MFGLAPLFLLARGLLRCLFNFVVWLENLSAGNGYAFRPSRWVREFSILASAGGSITAHRFSSVGESDSSPLVKDCQGDLAHCRFGPRRVDRRHGPSSRESPRRSLAESDISAWTSPLGLPFRVFPDGLFHALVILSLTMLPYVILRLQRSHSLSP